MAFSIIKPGLLDTIQDMGRQGFGNWGVNPGGAMDIYAAQVANLLVGNDRHEAVIEIHFPGPADPFRTKHPDRHYRRRFFPDGER